MPTEIKIEPKNGRRFADPAVPVRVGAAPIITRKPPPFGITSVSGWLLMLAIGLFFVALGAGISSHSPTVQAVILWASITVVHFAAGFFLWVDPLPGWRVLFLPVLIPAAFGGVLLSFFLQKHAPGWVGWVFSIAGLLAVAASLVPMSAIWASSAKRSANDFRDQPLEV
jgi:hypothetical protein